MHVLLVQAAVALGKLQTLPQPLQLFTSVVVAASQPSAGLPLQSAKPVPQVGTHLLALQLVDPWSFVQAAPHAPQLALLVVRSISQPLLTLLSQSPKLVLHVSVHFPALHEGVSLLLLHAFVQLPQCATSLSVFVSQSGFEVSQLA